MNDLVLASQVDSLVLDSPITRRVYALALGEPHRVKGAKSMGVRVENRPFAPAGASQTRQTA
jgi:hypothetical protein